MNSVKYKYRVSGNKNNFSKITSFAKGFAGVLSVEMVGDALIVELEEHASEYDLFRAITELGDSVGVDVDYYEDVVEKVVDEPQEEQKPEETEVEVEEEEEDPDDKKKAQDELPDEEKPWKTRFIPQLIEIGLALVLFIVAQIFDFENNTKSFLYLISFCVVGYEIIWDAVSEIMKKRYINCYVPILLASVLAVFITTYEQATLVVIVSQVVITLGKILKAVNTDNLKKRLYFNYVKFPVQNDETRFAKDVSAGESINLVSGQVAPFDCVVVEGEVNVDTYNYSGVHTAEVKASGSKINGGDFIVNGEADVRVEQTVENSLAGKIYKAFTTMQSVAEKQLERKLGASILINLAVAVLIIFLAPLMFIGEQSYSSLLSEWALAGVIYIVSSSVLALVVSRSISKISALKQALSLGSILYDCEAMELLANSNRIILNRESITENDEIKSDAYGAIRELRDVKVKTAIVGLDKAELGSIANIVKVIDGDVSLAKQTLSNNGENPITISNNESADVYFGKTEELKSITIENTSLKSVAKTIKLSKRKKNRQKLCVTLGVIFNAIALVLGVVLFFTSPAIALSISVAVQGFGSIICLLVSFTNGQEVY